MSICFIRVPRDRGGPCVRSKNGTSSRCPEKMPYSLRIIEKGKNGFTIRPTRRITDRVCNDFRRRACYCDIAERFLLFILGARC